MTFSEKPTLNTESSAVRWSGLEINIERGRSSNALLTKQENSNLSQAIRAKRELACRLHKDKMAATLATAENEK